MLTFPLGPAKNTPRKVACRLTLLYCRWAGREFSFSSNLLTPSSWNWRTNYSVSLYLSGWRKLSSLLGSADLREGGINGAKSHTLLLQNLGRSSAPHWALQIPGWGIMKYWSIQSHCQMGVEAWLATGPPWCYPGRRMGAMSASIGKISSSFSPANTTQAGASEHQLLPLNWRWKVSSLSVSPTSPQQAREAEHHYLLPWGWGQTMDGKSASCLIPLKAKEARQFFCWCWLE